MCKQPLMIKPYLSAIISESAVFYYLNLQACLIKFRVILCQQVGRKVRIAVFSQRWDTCRLWYCNYPQILGKFAKNVFFNLKMLLGLCKLKLLLWEDDEIKAQMRVAKIVHRGNFLPSNIPTSQKVITVSQTIIDLVLLFEKRNALPRVYVFRITSSIF